MDHRPSHYNTVRILAPVLPFYDHATATTHHRHIAAGPGPGPGPGGGGGGGTYGQSILVPTTPFHHHHHHQIYHTRAFSTVNPAKLSKQSNMMIYGHLQQPKVKHQQTEQSGSSLNTWFTWKRKSKNNSSSNGTQRPINVHSHHHHHHHHHSQQQQHQHVSEYCPAANGSQSHVPPSLARLFVQPNGRSATTNCTTSPSSTSSKPMCLCSGLTQSTFMAPTYFDDDDDDATNDKDKQHRATSLESSNHLKYKSKTLKSHKSGKSSFEMNGTIRSISTGSLLLTTNGNKNDCSISTKNQQQQQQKRVTRPFNTLNMNRLNQAKSCDQLHSNSSMEYGSFNTTNRKSILECDINPYELIETERKHKTKDKIKCATIAVKSSRNGYRTKREIDDGDEYEDYLDENEDYEQHHHRSISTLNRHGHGRSRIHKGIFQAANSIRIAGQSVYSSIKNDTNHLTYSEYDGSGVGGGGVDKSGKFKSSIDVNQSVNDDRPKMLRCKSSTSLCEWNFDSSTTNTTERTKPKAANFHSILIEPEPDYDMEESEIILDHSKTTDGGTNQSIESSKCDTINRRIRSSSITRPKVNPPPPPEPISLPPPTIAPPPPPPPPPPPSDYFTSSENSSPTISLSTLSSSISTLKPIGSINGKSSNLQPSDSISFQNELKEKLNQGVKSILKKTTTNRIVDESSNDSSNDSLESNVDSSSSSTLTTSSSVENRIQAFEQSTTILNGMEPSMIKPKKHVHFRVKTRNGHLSRSRSTSHIITETIHEEDDEHSYYDDVAIPSSAVNSGIIGTRSFDDVSIVSCSSPTLSTLDRRTIHNDQQQNCSVSDTETRASPNSIKNRNDSNQDHGGSSSSSTINVSSSSMDRQSESTYDTKCNNNDDENDDGRRTMSMPNINQRTSLECCHRHHPNAYDQLVCEVANGDVIVHEPNDQPQSSCSMNNMIGRMSNVRSTKHRFDANSSPTPPPIPARRLSTMLSIELQKPIKQESNDQSSQQTKNSFSRAVRTYSTGSVRSLLARKLNRSISGNSARLSNSQQQQQQQQKSNGSKLTLSNLFSMKPIDNERSMANVKNNDQVEEHIYEELDSVYVDAITEQQHHKQLPMSNRSTTLSSFFGGRISRAEILDYLHDAKGRLEKQEINVIDCKKLELDENHDIEDIDDDDDIDDVDQVIDENNHKRSSSSPPLLRPLITNTNDVNDSGNSSFIDSIDYRSTDLSPPYGYEAKSRLRKTRTRNGSPSNIDNTDDVNGNLSSSSSSSSSTTTPTLNSSTTGVVSQSTISSGVNRRNRVSNVSNSSTDSSATSGVSGISSNLSDDVEEDDMNTNSSSSSLGSIGAGADGSAGSASCYYGSLDSSVPIRKGSPTAIVLERNDSGVGPEISSSLTKTKSTNESQTSSRDEYHHYNNRLRCLDCDHESSDNAINDCGSTTNHSGSSSSSSSSSYYYSTFHQPNLCTRCVKKRNERKEIISEIVDTELKYGRDLKIIQDEFARPISVAGLLTTQQVDEIFLNLDELIEVNEHFAEQLRDTLNCAYEQNDMDLTTANIGQLFHDCMLARISVFEQYCIRQGSASLLLNQLEKEKELLRIFLRVSQMENTLLRRMNLRSFLVVPVQRVTKYPLLLNRLHKVTSVHHPDRESLRDAQLKLEFYLESINQKTRGSIAATTSRIWRRISNLSSASIRSKAPSNDAYLDDFGFVRLKKTAIDLLKWPKEECRFVLMGKLSFIVEKSGTSSEQINLTSTYSSSGTIFNQSSSSANNGTGTTNSSSSFWSRTLKFSMANGILVTLSSESLENLTPSEPNSLTLYDDAETINESNRYNSTSRRFNAKCSNRNNATTGTHSNHGNNKNGVREAVLLLFKEKNGRYVLCREILNLAMCVIANATEADSEEFFEIHELESRESLLLKAETHSEMKEWLEQLRHHSSGLGNWRRRRNALPNIMVLRNVIEEQHF